MAGDRNLRMAERIAATPARYPFSFVIAGDSGAWPDPTAEAIFAQLLRQTAALDPAPVFFANLGDFAGPGTRARHDAYLAVVDPLPMPDICVVGNHDLDDDHGAGAWDDVHGPANFTFAHGQTRFVAIDAAPGEPGQVDIPLSGGVEGPRDDALAFLAHTLEAAPEPHRVVLMHCPPHSAGASRRIPIGGSRRARRSSSRSWSDTTSRWSAARTPCSSTTVSAAARTSSCPAEAAAPSARTCAASARRATDGPRIAVRSSMRCRSRSPRTAPYPGVCSRRSRPTGRRASGSAEPPISRRTAARRRCR